MANELANAGGANLAEKSVALDDGFKQVKAKLITANQPFNPWTGGGDPFDDARYIVKPGVNFMRPWIAIRGGDAFQWQGGLQGFTLAIDATLGIHKYIGDDDVKVEVIHASEEHFTLSGNFLGDSAPDNIQALTSIVRQKAPTEGKILWLPEVVTYAQRVEVVRAEFTRADEDRGRDFRYSIEFVRMGTIDLALDPEPEEVIPQPTEKVRPKRSVKVDAKHNTLRKIALWKLGSSKRWRIVYNANMPWFVKRRIALMKAPDYRLPRGTRIYY
jgi:hypothetical protein